MIAFLAYAYRVLATGFCFAVFGLGGLVLSFTLFPLLSIIYRQPHKKQQAAKKWVSRTFRFFVNLMQWVGVGHFQVPDAHLLAQQQGKLVMANHPSLIDVVVLIAYLPSADCVVKASLLRNPFMNRVIQATGYISNDDPETVLSACKASLAAGNNLIIFPEGTRTTPGQPPKLQRGAANIAVRCGATPLILGIDVSPSTLTKDKPWYQVPKKRFTFSVKIKDNAPLPIEGDVITKETRRYTRSLQAFFSEEIHQYE
ncbi:lysophospholipid acyltransferase family protein [Alteromonas sp. C1M14]|uniref:lysophospholipid acyltransferase family protein n=1 Tax=Alteromonas sp. C1M14 TaxID=2841567 RepID=UPI001C08D4FD|nr:lysophospholipid acyltransferase family protein [Alteromonas sp. C1M14]MBU2979654.1 1-acyl-sn-glycerol-3-phosphate acyltransferase [Alteromonas sp. C1M14]